ncbi:hypothetical protein DFR31_0880 [Alkalispirillum mobile]|uniref:DUF4148 domain-containing protein n=1 Tax=Alkalispirillum mobile TaxID=85925 RepID=A0A498CEX0_9GAMM|nr:hypothetical protein [Alkalispirillum mobile]RLK50968.1 hypothetical protein DFR31_0880 [Alkalispirillum mobile]
MKPLIKTAVTLTLGAGLTVSGLASAQNWTTFVDQVRANPPTTLSEAQGAGVGQNYETWVNHVRDNGPEERSFGDPLVGQNYLPFIQSVRERTLQRKQAERPGAAQPTERERARHGRNSVLDARTRNHGI